MNKPWLTSYSLDISPRETAKVARNSSYDSPPANAVKEPPPRLMHGWSAISGDETCTLSRKIGVDDQFAFNWFFAGFPESLGNVLDPGQF